MHFLFFRFELVMVANKRGKTYPICPLCYNDPPFGAASAANKDFDLQHPIYKKYRPAIFGCFEDNCSGTICLDVDSAPKWQMDCNVCPVQIQLFEDKAHKIKAAEECEECGGRKLNVEFNKTKTPLASGETQKTACIQCDEEFNALCVSDQSKRFVRRRPGKGKGKGKGKKGKGGNTADDDAERKGRLLAKQGRR